MLLLAARQVPLATFVDHTPKHEPADDMASSGNANTCIIQDVISSSVQVRPLFRSSATSYTARRRVASFINNANDDSPLGGKWVLVAKTCTHSESFTTSGDALFIYSNRPFSF